MFTVIYPSKIGLNYGTNYNAGLKQDFDVRVGSKIGFRIFGQFRIGQGISQILVINRVRILGSGPHTLTQFFWDRSTPRVKSFQ